MHSVHQGLSAGLTTWRNGPEIPAWDALQMRYAERQMLHNGDLFIDAWRNNPYKNDPRVYKNISLLWNHVRRVNDFYASTVYQGELKAIPGEGAIPIRPDPVLTTAQVTALMTAIDVLQITWNWQKHMTLRPKLGAALGDVLTELIDDGDKMFVFPKIIWPGYVKEIDLDYVGNVVSYTLEYRITEENANGARETYTFRKEVDRDTFRYFRNDRPYDYYGEGSVVENPYGFVPAIWDQHITDGMNVRGYSATDVSRQALFNLNSLFSHSRDFQHKAFLAPVIVAGKISGAGQNKIDLSAPQSTSAMAESLSFLEGGDGVRLEQPAFDIGQTLSQLEMMRDGILATHPEATFFDKLADASNVTGPGADRIILPVKGLVEQARSSYDNNTVHLFQMAISMCGMRISRGDWDAKPTKSREAFRPFTLDSYTNEQMGFTIAARDIVPPSRAETIDLARQTESLQTLWGLQQAGIDETIATKMISERQERYAVTLNSGAFGADYGGGGE